MESFVEFPNLGLKFEVSDILFQFDLFGATFTIRWYGVLIALGFLLAILYGMKRAKYFDIDPDRMFDVIIVSAIFAFIGARLYYVLFSSASERAAFFDDPISILKIWEGGLGIYGGIIMAFITALWMCRVRKVNTLAMFDVAGLGFLIGQCIGRWGNFFNQEAFGGNTDLPWGMTGNLIQQGLNGSGFNRRELVHPTFLYESLWCLLGFILLHIISKKAYKFKGQIFSMYIIWYGLGRFMIEGLRTDSLMIGTMRVSQLVAVLSIIGGIVLFFVFKNYANHLPKDLFKEEEPVPADGPALEGEEESSEDEPESEGADHEEDADADDAEVADDMTEETENMDPADGEDVIEPDEQEDASGEEDVSERKGQ